MGNQSDHEKQLQAGLLQGNRLQSSTQFVSVKLVQFLTHLPKFQFDPRLLYCLRNSRLNHTCKHKCPLNIATWGVCAKGSGIGEIGGKERGKWGLTDPGCSVAW